PVALLLMFCGALNWGIVGITDGDTNVLSSIFGSGTLLNVVSVIIAPSRGRHTRAPRPGPMARLASCYVASVAVHTSEIQLSTRGHSDIVDITRRVQAGGGEGGGGGGQATAFVRGSTAAITTMEFEPGGVHDLRALLDRLIPVH